MVSMQTSWPLGGNTRVGTCPSCGTRGQPRDKPILPATSADCSSHQQVKQTYTPSPLRLTQRSYSITSTTRPSINPNNSRRTWETLREVSVYIALTFMLQIQPIYSVSEAETMPLFTVAGSASLLGSKIARICFQQLSFPTFSNAEGLLIFFILFFLSTEAQGRNVRGLVQDFTASRLCLPFATGQRPASRLPAVRPWIAAPPLCASVTYSVSRGD